MLTLREYLSRVLTRMLRMFPDAWASGKRLWAISAVLLNGLGIGAFAVLDGWSPWIPSGILGATLALSFVWSTIKEYKELEMKHATLLSKTMSSRGVVIRFPQEQIKTRGPGAGWEVRLDKVELTNQSDRRVRLCMMCFFKGSGEPERCKLLFHQEGVDDRGQEQLSLNPLEDGRFDLVGIFGGGTDQGADKPTFDYLEVTDRAHHPQRTKPVRELPCSVELFSGPQS